MDIHLKLVMPSNPHVLSIARAAVSELAAVCGFSPGQCQAITLAIDEGLANIIRHAYKNLYDREMELHCSADADRLVFILFDQGEAPDPARICAEPLNDFSLGGRGTHLIKEIMDEMYYEQAQGTNKLTLVKRIPAEKESSGA